MGRQEYWCEKCGIESHILHNDHAGVGEVVYLLDDDHKKLSPECNNLVTKLIILNVAYDRKH